MKTRSLVLITGLVLCASLSLAQQPRQVQRQPVERPLSRRNITLVDLRTATPLVAKAGTARASRMSSMPPGVGKVAQALTAAELRTAFIGAGLNDVPSASEYCRFTPTQLSAGEKGYILFEAPVFVRPSEVWFNTALDAFPYLHLVDGPKVLMREAGTFVLDFSIFLYTGQKGTPFRCDVLKGQDVIQQMTVTSEPVESQHILVVFRQDVPNPPGSENWIGISLQTVEQTTPPESNWWWLYQVVVTKL